MPAKNTRKIYKANGYYHLYNRGVEKRNIFENEQDYGVFLSYLKTYLSPKNEKELDEKLSDPKLPWPEKDKILKLLRLNNFVDEIHLLAYCLMPNHFHFLVKQKSATGIDVFMNSLNTRYVMYFNKKYKRVGPLYQGTYKAVLVETDEQFLHLSAYIHRNPAKLVPQSKTMQGVALQTLTKQPSSLPEYLGLRNSTWLKPDEILSFFSRTNKNFSYEKFVLGYTAPDRCIYTAVLD